MDAQEKVARILMNRIRNDRYPSYTEMGLLEAALPPELRDEYLDILLEKVMQDSRPSITMLRHIQQLAAGA
jgi:hypothetical protein